jgi:hypothetical protein
MKTIHKRSLAALVAALFICGNGEPGLDNR